MAPQFNTKLSSVLPVRVPLIGAPMGGVSGGALAAAVSQAGGFGFIGNLLPSLDFLNEELKAARSILGKAENDRLPIGVGFLVWLLDRVPDVSEQAIKIVAPQVDCIWLSFGEPDRMKYWYDQTRAACGKVKIAFSVNRPEQAIEAASLGVDIIAVQGIEAGGHGAEYGYGGPIVSLLPAVLEVLPADSRPAILAAGGIGTGAQAAAMLALGADGFAVGTRLCATDEAGFALERKQALVDAKYGSSERSRVYDLVSGSLGWPEGVDGRGLKNTNYEEFQAGRSVDEIKADFATAMQQKYLPRTTIWAGSSVNTVKAVVAAGDIVREFERDIASVIGRLSRQVIM